MNKDTIMILRDLLKMFGQEGEFAIVRKDGKPLGLGDQLLIGGLFELAERQVQNG